MNSTNESQTSTHSQRTTCAIAGGGPAGLILGLLLARAGVKVTVLEKHADFLRDFRGDTVHPTTMSLLDDLGLFERFNELPQSRITKAQITDENGEEVRLADFTRLPLRHPYIAMVPQWDLLNLIAEAAAQEPTFTLLTEHEVTGVVKEGRRVVGVEYSSPDGDGQLLADLTVACDGRWSTVRRSTNLPSKEFPVDFDVWWYRLPTTKKTAESLLPRMKDGQAAIAIPREGYLQVAHIGLKGTDDALRAKGIEAFRAQVADLMPELADSVKSLESMDDIKHLDVRVDRLRRWHDSGVLCIGDAAHAMSPVGGVGINLAVQDAVAAARLLAKPLAAGELSRSEGDRALPRVYRRRIVPTVIVQQMQRLLHSGVIMPALNGKDIKPPKQLTAVLKRIPALTAIPAFLVGVGPLPEKAPKWAHRPALKKQHEPEATATR